MALASIGCVIALCFVAFGTALAVDAVDVRLPLGLDDYSQLVGFSSVAAGVVFSVGYLFLLTFG